MIDSLRVAIDTTAVHPGVVQDNGGLLVLALLALAWGLYLIITTEFD